jgi:integrase/recombinase XerD
VEDLVDLFLDHLAVERALSPATVEAYARDLRLLVGAVGHDTPPAAVTRDQLLAFARADRRAPSSRARTLAAVRTFFRFLQGEGHLDRDPSDVLQGPRLPRRLPHTLDRASLQPLLEAPGAADGSPLACRDRAILELLYASGLRASEVICLRVEDIRLDRRYLRCTGKGGKERLVPLGRPAVQKVRRYLNETRSRLLRRHTPAPAALFLSIRGRPLSRQALWRLVRRHGRAAGLPEGLYPHLFRHTFATHLVEEGADLRVVQELLGHARVATTQIYAHVDRRRLRSVHAAFHPRAR